MSIAIAKVKKGDTVILCAFTGMKLGVKEVVAADKSTVTIKTDKGDLVFDRKTTKQINPEPKAPRFANSIIEDDGSYVPPQRGKKDEKSETKKPAKKAVKKSEPEEEEDDTPAPKKTKKKPAAKKKPAPKPEPEEEEDEDEDWEDEDEDWEDEEDDFEEIDD